MPLSSASLLSLTPCPVTRSPSLVWLGKTVLEKVLGVYIRMFTHPLFQERCLGRNAHPSLPVSDMVALLMCTVF
jgi:hypothetical protein